MKKILAAIVAVGLLVIAPAALWATGHSYYQGRVNRLVNSGSLPMSSNSGAFSSKWFNCYFQNDSPCFDIVFDEGAGKGVNLVQTDFTAFSDTANDLNWVTYGRYRFLHSPTTSTGATTPIGIAGYLDIGDGNTSDNDVDEYWWGMPGSGTGRPFVVGSDPAFYMCATTNSADTADAEEFLVGFVAPGSTAVSAVPQAAAIGSHIDYAVIGEYDTAATCTTACPIYVLTGIAGTDVATDTTDIAADATDYRLCVYVSAAGAVTYTKNGSAPTATAAATMGDGVLLVPYVRIKTNGTDDSNQLLARVEAGFQ